MGTMVEMPWRTELEILWIEGFNWTFGEGARIWAELYLICTSGSMSWAAVGFMAEAGMISYYWGGGIYSKLA